MEEVSIKVLESKALSLPGIVRKIEVKDDESLKRANQALVYIKSVRKEINSFCDKNIKRLNEAHKEALAQKKSFEQPLIEAEKIIKPGIASYMAKLEQERKEEELKEKQKLEAETAFGKIESDVKVVVHKEKPKLHGTYIRKDLKWRIINLDKIPDKYKKKIVDTQKIDDEVKLFKEKTNIPGIEVYQKDTVVSRSDF